MKVILLEDEEPASKRLKKLLLEIDPSIIVLETIVSVAGPLNGVTKITTRPCVSDIQLADGTEFLLRHDQYAIAAFKVNSIDYY
jgi:DNA-binding LytR/AlgR family response regulator